MQDIRHKVGIKGSKSQIFQAINTQSRLASWWTRNTKAETFLGGKIQFSFAERLSREYDVEVEITALKFGEQVQWHVIKGPKEWLGTEINFEIKEQEKESILYFTHGKWLKPTDFMAQCNTKWAVFLLSLKELVETGRGRPFPDDLRIGHWGA